MVRVFLIISICLSVSLIVSAQEDRTTEKDILYEHATDFGVLVHTRGYGVDVQLIKQRTVNNLRLIDFSIYELKNPKEISQPNPLIDGSQPYVFGKLNNLVAFNVSYGTRYVIADRYIPTNIKMNLNYSIGAVIGWLKPVYYDVRVLSADSISSTIIQAKFDPKNIDYQNNTMGPSSIFKGMNQSFFIYGASAKMGLSFEWGKYEYNYYSLETGVMVDAFPTPVPIFATIKNDQVFVNLYLTLTYGIRK